MVYNYDPSNLSGGGGITYVHNLINSLLNHGVKIILFGKKLSENQEFKHPNLEFIPVMDGKGNLWKFLINLRNSINSNQLLDVDIIHTHNPLSMYPFIKSYPDVPKICTFHGMPLDWVKINYSFINPIISPIYKHIEKKIINDVDKITTAGPYTKMRLIKRYPELDLETKILSIPSGVDIDKFKPMDKDELKMDLGLDNYSEIIMFVGRIAEIKNLNLLLKSYSLIKSKYVNSALVIVGKGEKLSEIKDLTNKLGLRNVIFTGDVNSGKVVKLINCADVLTLMSWFEASPTVVREALSCGVPVVTTNVGDVKNLITNKYVGQIVNSYDEADYSEALTNVIELVKHSPEIVRNNCRKLAYNQFNFINTFNLYMNLYKELSKKN